MSPLPYPVLWCDVETAEKLFCIAPSTFREHVAEGRLPQGVKIGKKRLWRVADVDEALAKLLPRPNDEDEIMRLIRGMGNEPKSKARSNAA